MHAGLVAPSYLPALARPLLSWTRGHVARVSKRYALGRDDLWDEAMTALLRASVYYKPETGAFPPYGRTAVHRALWRYCVRGAKSFLPIIPDADDDGPFGAYDREACDLRDMGTVDLGAPASASERDQLAYMLRMPSPEDCLIALEDAARVPAAPIAASHVAHAARHR